MATLALIVAIVLWSSAYVAIRVGLRGFDPGTLALLRFSAASAILLGMAAKTGIKRPRKEDWGKIALTAFCLITGYHIALNTGEVQVPAAVASFVMNLVPISSALLAMLFLGERLNVLGYLGLATGTSGLVLLTMSGSQSLKFTSAVLWIVFAAVVEAVGFIVQKGLLNRYPSFGMTQWLIWIGVLPMFAFAHSFIQEARHAPSSAWMAGLYLAVFPGVIAYSLWNFALSKQMASVAAGALCLVPVVTVLLGWLVLKEFPSPSALVGGAISIIGVFLLLMADRSRRRKDHRCKQESALASGL